jgi:uncharacterized repeat protein (TIGR03803 family)
LLTEIRSAADWRFTSPPQKIVDVVWMVSNIGTETVLHSSAGNATDGGFPQSGVILDTTGNLYGVTEFGGASNLGTVYELDASGTVALLHSFAGSDGSYPTGAVIQDIQGNFYGASSAGGSGPCREGCGTVWTLAP